MTFNPAYDNIFRVPIILKNENNPNNLKNVILFDMEVDGKIGTVNKKYTYIPNIREWSVIKLTVPFTKEDVMAPSNLFEYKNVISNWDAIDAFCYLYEKLNYPHIIAHNGCKFDFLILIANIHRYIDDVSILTKMKFFDSFSYIKSYMKSNPLRLDSLKNRDIFLHFQNEYKKYAHIVRREHHATEDSQMMGLWLIQLYKTKILI